MGATVDTSYQRLITGSITAVSQNIDLTSPNQSTEMVQLSGTWVGTLIIEGSNDGITYYPLIDLLASGLITTNITANGIYTVNTNAFAMVRIRSSAWTSGTATINAWGSDSSTITTNIALMRGGSDGTIIGNNGDKLKVEATPGVVDKTTFTYGTSTEQPIGGVYQDTSPSLTAGQTGALRSTANRGLHTNLRDSNGTEITSSSNGNAANQLLHTQTPDTTTTITALNALNANVSIAMAGLASVGFQIAAGTLIGTITPQCSVDGGTTWTQASFYDPINSTISNSIVFSSANTQKILSVLPIGGASHVRVIVTAFTSGTANSLLRASEVTGAAGAVTAAAFGNVTNTYPTLPGNTATLILAANTNRKYAYISNNSGSQLNIQFGSSTGIGTNAGLVIPAKTFYELKGDNLFTGNIYGFAAGGITISITEGTP